MLPWVLIAGMSTALLYHFGVLGMSDEDQIQRAFAHALAHEDDQTVLLTFASKLSAAGYAAEAKALTNKASKTSEAMISRPKFNIGMVRP